MVLEHYISELLYRYNCIMVPDFGAFLAQNKSAVIHRTANSIYPPTKEVSFNEQVVTNDGLLVSYIAEAEKASYEDTLVKVSNHVAAWKQQLREGKKLDLNALGILMLNESGKIQFQPENSINYQTASFGLSSFSVKPIVREVLKSEVETLEEKIPFVFTPEQRKRNTIRPYLKYAAVFLLTVTAGLTAYQYFNNNSAQQQLVQEEAREQVTKRIQQATFFDMEPVELPSISLDVVTPKKEIDERVHHIVAGAFRFQKNADKKIRQLNRLGFNASYIGTNKFGLHMVTYDSFTDVDEALNSLKRVKRNHSRDAWLLSSK